jgi:hypothetical protein
VKSIANGWVMLLLAGCQVPVAEQKNAIDRAEVGVVNGVEAPPSAAGAAAGGGQGAIITDGKIPPRFQGRWGLVPADCTSTRGDNKGLMTVGRDRLSFYESRASVSKIEALSPTELKVSLAFTGEGQEWTQDTPLVLEQNGNVLTRFADGQTLRYTRCGA